MAKTIRPITVEEVVARFDTKGKVLKVMQGLKADEGWTDEDMQHKCGGMGKERWRKIVNQPEFRPYRVVLTSKKVIWGGKRFLSELRKRIPRQIMMEI